MGVAVAANRAGARRQGATREIIDTHTHFYDPTRPQGVPWPSKTDAALYRPVYPEEFKAIARPLGVTGTVVVEASPWLARTISGCSTSRHATRSCSVSWAT